MRRIPWQRCGVGLALVAASAVAWADDIVLRSDEWCPVSCSADADPPGYLVEIAERALRPAGLTVRHEVMNWARIRQDAATTPDNEAVLGIERTASTLRSYIFPDVEQGESPTCFYAYQDRGWRYSGAPSLQHVTLGVVNGYSYGPTVDAYLGERRHGRRISAANGDHAVDTNFRKLALGRVDVVLEGRQVAQYLHRGRSAEAPLHELGCVPDAASRFYIAFNRRSPQAQAWADAVAAETRRLRASGELARILGRYGLKDWQDGSKR